MFFFGLIFHPLLDCHLTYRAKARRCLHQGTFPSSVWRPLPFGACGVDAVASSQNRIRPHNKGRTTASASSSSPPPTIVRSQPSPAFALHPSSVPAREVAPASLGCQKMSAETPSRSIALPWSAAGCRRSSFLRKQDPSPRQGEDDGIGIVIVPASDDSRGPAIPHVCVAFILCSRKGSGRRLGRRQNEHQDHIPFHCPPAVGRGDDGPGGRCSSFLAKQDPSPQRGEDDGIRIVVVPAPNDSTEPAIPRICIAFILCSREGSGRRLSRLSKNERRDRISFNRPPMVGRGVSMQ
jgi:hypothetical protein